MTTFDFSSSPAWCYSLVGEDLGQELYPYATKQSVLSTTAPQRACAAAQAQGHENHDDSHVCAEPWWERREESDSRVLS